MSARLEDQLDAAVAAAKTAFPAWAATPIEKRRELVTKMAAAIEANTNELARLLTTSRVNLLPTQPVK